MWELYTVLKDGSDSQQEFLVDEVYSLLDKVSSQDFIRANQILYGNKVSSNPVEFVTQFVAGLKRNEFFSFVDIVKGIQNGRSARG